MNELIRRQRACEAVMSAYEHRAFEWGTWDCITMILRLAEELGRTDLPKPPRYGSAVTAGRALRKMGAESLEDLFNQFFTPIPVIGRLPGDVVLMKGTDGFGAAGMAVGVKVYAFHEDAKTAKVCNIFEFDGAWRV